jgi:hypothetical protein
LWAHTVDKPANILVRAAIEEVLAEDGAVEVAAEEAVYWPPLDRPTRARLAALLEGGLFGHGPPRPVYDLQRVVLHQDEQHGGSAGRRVGQGLLGRDEGSTVL